MQRTSVQRTSVQRTSVQRRGGGGRSFRIVGAVSATLAVVLIVALGGVVVTRAAARQGHPGYPGN